MILLIDNYDSFVHNLARYVRELGAEAIVCRNDEVGLDDIERLAPTHIVLSPGPCSPAEAGVSIDVVRRFGATVPVLGVCLGHQCIGAAYGGRVVRAGRPVHGRTSAIVHDGRSILEGLPSPFLATRYHSLVIDRGTLPPALHVLASSADDGEIMAVAHERHPVVGLQFHPESAASEFGYVLLERFLRAGAARRNLPSRADWMEAPAPAAALPPWAASGPHSLPDAGGELFVPPPVELVR